MLQCHGMDSGTMYRGISAYLPHTHTQTVTSHANDKRLNIYTAIFCIADTVHFFLERPPSVLERHHSEKPRTMIAEHQRTGSL